MKKLRSLSLAIFVGVAFGVTESFGQAPVPKLGYGDFTTDLALRARYELMDWLEPSAPGVDSSYPFAHTKLQLGLKFSKPWIKAYVQGQYFQLYDLPSNGSGPGSVYYNSNDKDQHPGDVVLRQAYLTLLKDSASATVGRFLYSNGMEGLSKDEAVVQLRQKRISERVIGPFDFTGGRSFDGLRLGWKQPEHAALDFAAFRPTQGGFATDASSEIEDIFLFTSAISATPEVVGSADIQMFYYFYSDDRGAGTVKTDNRPLEARKLDADDIRIHNFGFHAVDVFQSGNIRYDWLFWALAQSGDWGGLDHSAVANAIEGGVRFEDVSGKPWVRIGWNWSTGDGSPDDGDHHTFFQMLPTTRLYAETPFYNLMNNQELFVTTAANFSEDVSLKFGASYLWAAQAADLLYSGGGATEESQFGYSGAALGASRNLGLLSSLQCAYKVLPNLTLSAYYGHLFGASGLDGAYSEDKLDFGFLEALVKY